MVIYLYIDMNSAKLDVSVAAASLVVLVLAIFALPKIMPAGYGAILALVLFVLAMSGGGYIISKNYKPQ